MYEHKLWFLLPLNKLLHSLLLSSHCLDFFLYAHYAFRNTFLDIFICTEFPTHPVLPATHTNVLLLLWLGRKESHFEKALLRILLKAFLRCIGGFERFGKKKIDIPETYLPFCFVYFPEYNISVISVFLCLSLKYVYICKYVHLYFSVDLLQLLTLYNKIGRYNDIIECSPGVFTTYELKHIPDW